jgi:hypothetical protein
MTSMELMVPGECASGVGCCGDAGERASGDSNLLRSFSSAMSTITMVVHELELIISGGRSMSF